MFVQSLVNILEAAIADRRYANLAGHVRDFPSLLKPENLATLEQRHEGLFAFFAFHPMIDLVVADYLRSGSLAGDTGPRVFALFVLDVPAHTPVDLTTPDGGHWATIAAASYSATDLIRDLFPDSPLPALPAIVFLERLSGRAEPVSVSLSGATTSADVRTRCLRAFDAATRAYAASTATGQFSLDFSRRLSCDGLEHTSGGPVSVFAWLTRTMMNAHSTAGSVATVVNFF